MQDLRTRKQRLYKKSAARNLVERLFSRVGTKKVRVTTWTGDTFFIRVNK